MPETTVCVVGAGPAGMTLAYLLARQGVAVTLLESHADFDREFRGDTFHSTAMELMDQLGLVDKVEPLIHSKLQHLQLTTESGTIDFVNLSLLRSKFPYVALIPQSDWLDLMAEEAARFPSFELEMSAICRGAIEEDGRVVGVRYRQDDQDRELRATLTVAADGRGSRLRKAAGLELVTSAPPMDVIWLQLPKGPGDERVDPLGIRIRGGAMIVVVDRRDYWQLGYVIIKGSRKEMREQGIEHFQQHLAELIPPFRERVSSLESWTQTQILAVQVGRVTRWHRPGLLLIGDAAHVMSPVGGVGINYAIMDAVAAANVLTDPLHAGELTDAHLAAVQKRRELPTRVIQSIQAQIQKRVISQAIQNKSTFTLPLPMRIIAQTPLLRRLPANVIGRGLRVERLRHAAPSS